jgi:hypothetical protein
VCVEDAPDKCLVCLAENRVEFDLTCIAESPEGYSDYDIGVALPNITQE